MHHIQIYLSNEICDKENIIVEVKTDTLSVDAISHKAMDILAAVFTTAPVIAQLVDLEGEELDDEKLLELKRIYREAPIKILGGFIR